MLHLKLDTDPRWVKNAVEGNIEEILTDHAWCEQKAASTAISYIILYSDREELVNQMTALAREEMAHFDLVHQEIGRRGFTLGRERKDAYVNELIKFIRKGEGRELTFMDRMLFAAMIEARSCERFKVLSENLSDPILAKFYRDLMESEARHYTMFLKLAKTYADSEIVDARWKEWIDFETVVIRKYGKDETIHG